MYLMEMRFTFLIKILVQELINLNDFEDFQKKKTSSKQRKLTINPHVH